MFTYEINVLCDVPGCDHRNIAVSEVLDWPDLRAALAAAKEEGWLVDETTLRAVCPDCATKR